MTRIQAHRGASAYRPENTLEAFALAAEQGADGIELDVHMTKDGYIVAAHDETLDRVSNGTGYINNYTLAELKKLNFNKTHPDGPACIIPTLDEVYALAVKTGLMLNIELKTNQFAYPEMPEKLIGMEREYNMGERVIYSSFNHYSLTALKQINPEAKTGLLYSACLVDPWVYAGYLAADAIHPHYSIIAARPEIVSKCHEHDILVNVWTVDTPDIINNMLEFGVDAVITNKPDLALECFAGRPGGRPLQI